MPLPIFGYDYRLLSAFVWLAYSAPARVLMKQQRSALIYGNLQKEVAEHNIVENNTTQHLRKGLHAISMLNNIEKSYVRVVANKALARDIKTFGIDDTAMHRI